MELKSFSSGNEPKTTANNGSTHEGLPGIVLIQRRIFKNGSLFPRASAKTILPTPETIRKSKSPTRLTPIEKAMRREKLTEI
jgi:hypothetical protein